MNTFIITANILRRNPYTEFGIDTYYDTYLGCYSCDGIEEAKEKATELLHEYCKGDYLALPYKSYIKILKFNDELRFKSYG